LAVLEGRITLLTKGSENTPLISLLQTFDEDTLIGDMLLLALAGKQW
jgi:hypothetical protein